MPLSPITFETITPLWTGDAQGKMDRLHETGLLGSLRWWCELFVRGLGGNAPDPAAEAPRLDMDQYGRLEHVPQRQRLRRAGLDDVSHIFGATNWRRRFRLSAQPRNLAPDEQVFGQIKGKSLSIPADRDYVNHYGKKKTPAWFLNDYPHNGRFDLHLIPTGPLYDGEPFDVGIIAGLLQFLADWTAVGAKNQLGLGVVRPANGRLSATPFYEWLCDIVPGRPDRRLPALDNLFLAQIEAPTADVQETFNLKYDLRQKMRHSFARNDALRHSVMGTTRRQRLAAKVKMSLPYQESGAHVMRVWGWLPHTEYPGGVTRDEVRDLIHNFLDGQYSLNVWREFNSPHDSYSRHLADNDQFVRELLHL